MLYLVQRTDCRASRWPPISTRPTPPPIGAAQAAGVETLCLGAGSAPKLCRSAEPLPVAKFAPA